MEREIKEYINKKDIINIVLDCWNDTFINNDIICLSDFSSEEKILQILVDIKKYLSVYISYTSMFHKNINILSYAHEINISPFFNKNEAIDIINKSSNSEKVIIHNSDILDDDLINVIHEKNFLKQIKIIFYDINLNNINLNNIYKIMEIKSLEVLHLQSQIINPQQIAKILCYVINNLNKYMKIVFDCDHMDSRETQHYLKLFKYNFKVHQNDYIFDYVPVSFRKFNFYDLNFIYFIKN